MKKHIAKSIIVALDFDGCIAIGKNVKIKYAKQYHGIKIKANQTTRYTYPLGPKKYQAIMDIVASEHILEYELAPGCKEVLNSLYGQSFRFVVITSRADHLMSACRLFIQSHKLPTSHVYNVSNDDRKKAIICTRLYARAMLEDSLSKELMFEDTFVKLFLIRAVWNAHEKVPESHKNKIIEIHTWKEFYKHLIQLKNMHEAICYFNKWENSARSVKKIAEFWNKNPQLCNKYFADYQRK